MLTYALTWREREEKTDNTRDVSASFGTVPYLSVGKQDWEYITMVEGMLSPFLIRDYQARVPEGVSR